MSVPVDSTTTAGSAVGITRGRRYTGVPFVARDDPDTYLAEVAWAPPAEMKDDEQSIFEASITEAIHLPKFETL